jgi:uncharacterized membrane protein required for colicin V production
MKVTVNIPYFLGAILAFVIAYMTATYQIDKYIHFAGELNALAFCATAIFLGIMCLMGSFERPKKSENC